jgi:hypothetical protein
MASHSDSLASGKDEYGRRDSTKIGGVWVGGSGSIPDRRGKTPRGAAQSPVSDLIVSFD